MEIIPVIFHLGPNGEINIFFFYLSPSKNDNNEILKASVFTVSVTFLLAVLAKTCIFLSKGSRTVKYLGILIDKNLNWKVHIDHS